MKILKIIACIFSILAPVKLFAQGSASVEMADKFREDGKIYVVVLGLVIILTGVILFLIRVDRKIFKLEKRLGKK
jgi:hypothetical protein